MRLFQGKNICIKNYVIFPTIKEITRKFPGATYISYPTGVCATAFVKNLNKIKNYGVFPPECLEKNVRKDIFLDLEYYNMFIIWFAFPFEYRYISS